MKNLSKIIVVFSMIIISDAIYAQSIDTLLIDMQIESILDNIEGESNQVLARELIENLIQNPININTCSYSDLIEIPYINIYYADKIIDYREKNGYFKSMKAVKTIFGNDEIYDLIYPFISVDNAILRRRVQLTSSVIMNLEKSSKYDSIYSGSNLRVINKLRMENISDNLSGNLLFEKDPGENSLYDFYSGSLNYKTSDFEVILGDYSIEFGQGLCIGRQSMFSKGTNTIFPTTKHFKGISPYRSTDENQFLRGMAATTKYNKFNLYFFYSNKNIDANIDIDNRVTSLFLTGLHRTKLEISKKNILNEKVYGGRITYEISNLKLAVNHYGDIFSNSFNQTQFYSLKGDRNSFTSFDYEVTYSNALLFGEVAYSSTNSFAILSGTIINISSDLSFSLLYRKYPMNYNNQRSSAFCESYTQNEEGFYFGLKISPIWYLDLTAYFDIFRFPYRTYYNPVPTQGKEGLLSCEVKYFKSHRLFVKYFEEIKDETIKKNDEFNRLVSVVSKRKRQNLRFEVNSTIESSLRLRERIEFSRISNNELNSYENGFLIFEDVSYKINNLSASLRMIYFDMDSYDSRIYEYESEIDGVFNNIQLYNRGKRFYIMLSYYFIDILDLSFKYSYTIYDDLKYIGSGVDMITGNKINRISMQLKIVL